MSSRVAGALLAVGLLVGLGACGILTPSETPPPRPAGGIDILRDLGLVGDPPAIPPDVGFAEMDGETAIIVVDGGGLQQVISARWNGERWESLGTAEGRFLPPGEELVLRRVMINESDGFTEAAVLLIGRIPNGPINQLDVTVDGAVERLRVNSRPVVVMLFPHDAVIGDRFTTIDARTRVLGGGAILDAGD